VGLFLSLNTCEWASTAHLYLSPGLHDRGFFCGIYTYSAKSISNEAQQIIVLKIAHRLKKYFRHHKL